MSSPLQCEPHLLQEAIQGTLTESTQDLLLDHLSHCRRCQQQLNEMAADDRDWQKLSDYFSIEGLLAPSEPEALTVDVQLNPMSTPGFLVSDRHESSKPDRFLQQASHPELLGRIDGFEVERVIGRGGMGVVYKGFDTELNRPVAIKVLVDHLAANGVARKRFAREARAAAAVIHPNVVPIHSVNSSVERPYIVMTLVSGRSLQSYISEEGPLGVKEVVRISKQIAAGLAAAHEQGLVHRDIKPANILLEKDVSRVMITDFGLARAADDAAITQTGWLAGTPHYMSPEQAVGKEVDYRSDLFSLGSVMYFMATGREPFRAEVPVAVLNKITTHEPEPIRSVNSDITRTLARIVRRLMCKDPGQRFASAEDVDQVLTQYLAHLEQPRLQRKPKVKAVRKTHWLRVACCLAALVGVTVGSAWWLTLPESDQTKLEDVDWSYELGELDRGISELESWSLRTPTNTSVDSFDFEVLDLEHDIQQLENGLNYNYLRNFK